MWKEAEEEEEEKEEDEEEEEEEGMLERRLRFRLEHRWSFGNRG